MIIWKFLNIAPTKCSAWSTWYESPCFESNGAKVHGRQGNCTSLPQVFFEPPEVCSQQSWILRECPGNLFVVHVEVVIIHHILTKVCTYLCMISFSEWTTWNMADKCSVKSGQVKGSIYKLRSCEPDYTSSDCIGSDNEIIGDCDLLVSFNCYTLINEL